MANDVRTPSEANADRGGHRGRQGEVPKFFEALGANIEVTEFTPLTFAGNDTDVLTVVRFGLRIPATGKQGAMDIHHWFRFNAAGKVERYRGTEDTAQTYELMRK